MEFAMGAVTMSNESIQKKDAPNPFAGMMDALGLPKPSLRYRITSWLEWHIVVRARRIRNRIMCMFGKHFAWTPSFYVLPGSTTFGPYSGVSTCASCGVERREDWADEMARTMGAL